MSAANERNAIMDQFENVTIEGEVVRVKNGQRTAETKGGRWLLKWGETYPEKFIGYEELKEPTAPPSELEGMVSTVALLASRIADCAELDPRDRNAIIGQLRSVAGQLRGLAGLPGFRQAPFAPTTPRIGDRPEPR